MLSFKKKIKQEEEEKMTIEEVRKAYEGLSDEDKTKFGQSLEGEPQDEPEAKEPKTAEESPAGEIDEGTEESSKTEETLQDKQEKTTEDETKPDIASTLNEILERIQKLEATNTSREKSPEPASEAEQSKLEALANRYTN